MTPEIKKYLTYAVVLVLVFAGGYGTALYTRPAKIVEKEKIVTVYQKDEVYTQQKIEEYKQTHKEEFTVVKWKKVTITKPCPGPVAPVDGCKPPCSVDCNKCPSQVISVDSGSTTAGTNTTNTASNTTTNTTDTTSTSTVTTDTKEKTTTYSKAQWRVSGMAGYDFNGSNWVFGGLGERRLAGPIWVGAWGLSNLNFGLSLGLEF